MHKTGVSIGLVLLLAACGDPLAGVTRISEVELSDTGPSAQALPTEQEIAREGFFGTDAAKPLDTEVPTEPETLTADPAIDPVVTAPAPRRGVFASLRRALPIGRSAPGGAKDTLSANAFETAKSAENAELPEQTQLASLSPEPDVMPGPAPKTRGFFSRLTSDDAKPKPRTGVDAMEVEYGAVVPYGTVARSCASKRQPLGRKIESASASGYDLYDTNPGAAGARTFYITGFDDGCPRQLTAAHVLLGAPSLYEQLHYGPAGQHLKFGATDKAYEKVKGKVCGVRKGKPCGAKMSKLERDTFFVNSYERLDDNTRWSELLVHDGQVLAASLKTN